MIRIFEYILALIMLVVLSPVLIIVSVLIKFDSHGPVIFTQKRMGKGYKDFTLYKFRSMTTKKNKKSELITSRGDKRVTRIGNLLRKTKIDEIPQLINVIKGDMGFVGARPEVKKYTDLFRKEFEEILKEKPGITDIASIKYRNEELLLAQQKDPEQYYISVHLPKKIELAKQYILKKSLFYDLGIIIKTIKAVIHPK